LPDSNLPAPRLVVATGNAGKLREYQDLLAPAGLDLVPLETGVPETGSTYEENAALKAKAALAATGLPVLADDAGIELDVLGGFPGLISARLGATQPERTARLLDRLQPHPRPWLGKFVCVLALALPGEEVLTFRGERRGEVIPEWRGTVGFGYDPIFVIPEVGKTFGEMPPAEKHRWSHRGQAVRKLLESGALDRVRHAAEARQN
jgi:XTP/dITP diphosphohydrolase